MRKRELLLYKEALVASTLVIIVDVLLSFLPLKFELIRPIKQGFNDFDVYDLHYSGGDSVVSKKDTAITLLEIGTTRLQIAEEISRVSAFHPNMIGVDAIFFAPGETPAEIAADSGLTDAIRRVPKLVLASKYVVDSGQESIQKSFFQSSTPGVKDGYYNFVEGPEEMTRHFTPFLTVNGQKYPAFTTRMLEQLNAREYQRLVGRNKRSETINYSGNLAHYNVVSLERILHPMKNDDLDGYFHNKIVLIGFFREQKPDVLEDLHFTPMNTKPVGKSFPDMYGVVIHANILEMMLSHRYVNEMPAWLVYLNTFIIVFFINSFYIRKISKNRHHSHLLLFLFQFALAIGLLYLALLIFDWFNFVFDLMPMLIAVVLSFEIFWLYEWLAVKLNKLFHYETILHE
jgi:CHASE2 domain-containing sensor protein